MEVAAVLSVSHVYNLKGRWSQEAHDLGNALELWRALEEERLTLGSSAHALEPYLLIVVALEL
jgi:hypothetical protein